MKRIIFSLLLVLLTLGLFAGEISGVVLDDNNSPIGNATIMLMQIGGHGGPGGPGEPMNVVTEEDGLFTFTELEPAVYHIMALAEGFLLNEPLEIELTEENPNAYDVNIVLVQFEEPEAIGSISGTVVDADSDPIVGAVVFIMGNGGHGGQGHSEEFEFETGEDGTFIFENLTAGTYNLMAFAEGYMSIESVEIEVAEENPDITGIEIVLTSFENPEGDGLVSGTIIDADENPVIGASVVLMRNGGHGGWGNPFELEVITGEDGAYLFENLPIATFHIFVVAEGYSPNQPVNVELTEEIPEITGLNITLEVYEEPEAIGSISGTVVDADNNPITGAVVFIMGNGGHGGQGHSEEFEFETGEDGTFIFEDLTAGTYNLMAFAEGYMSIESVEIEVTEENPDITGIEIVLTSFENPEGDGLVSGTIIDADENPVIGASVVLMRNGGHGGWGNPFELEVITGEDGAYLFENLPIATFHIFVVAEGYLPNQPVNVELTEEIPEITGLNITLEVYEEPEAIGSISGTVVDADNNPITGAVVFIMGNGGHGGQGHSEEFEFETGEDGTFIFENLTAGTYNLMAFADEYLPAEPMVVEITEEVPVITGISFTLLTWEDPEGEGLISGQIVNQEGEVVEALVHLTNQDLPLEIEMQTDENGFFQFENLSWGHYWIDVFAEGYLPGMLVHPNGEPATVNLSQNHPEVDNIVIELYPEGGGYEGVCQLTINVTGVSSPGAPVFITLFNSGMSFVYEDLVFDNQIVIDYLSEGDYYLTANTPGYVTYFYEDALISDDATLITLTEDNPVEISIDLTGFEAEEYSINGQILDNEGNPVQDALVNMMPVEGSCGWNGGSGHGGWMYETMAMTDSEGNYTITVLEGEYILSAFAPEYSVTFWPGTFMMDQAELVILDQDLTEMNLTLYPVDLTGFSISGSVAIEDEIPGTQVMVVAVSSDEDEENPYMEAVMVSSEGDYEIPLDFDGSYYVMAITSGAFPMFFPEVYDWEEAQEIAVNGVIEEIDFNLLYPQSQGIENISGIISDEDNVPLSGVTVVMSDDNGMPIAFGSTNSSGQYNIAFLGDMDYNLVATKIYYESYVTMVNPANDSQVDASLNPAWMTDSDDTDVPEIDLLLSNFPNPFNPETNIQFTISENDTDTRVVIYNSRGQKIKELVNDKYNTGTYSVRWEGLDDAGKSVSSGIYFYKMITDKLSVSKKMILMK